MTSESTTDRLAEGPAPLTDEQVAQFVELIDMHRQYGPALSIEGEAQLLVEVLRLRAETRSLRERLDTAEGRLAEIRKHQLAAVVGAYVSSEMDDAKRNDRPITHSLADRSRSKFRGALSVFQELLADLGEIEGDEDLEEAFVVVMAEIEIAKGLAASGHEFLPVNGHPDDDECTFRADGTDDTYCGATKAAHDLGSGVDR